MPKCGPSASETNTVGQGLEPFQCHESMPLWKNTQQACSGHPRNKMVWKGFTWLTCLSPNKSKIQPSSKQLINSRIPEKVLHWVHMEHENHVAHLSLAHSIGCWETVLQLPTSATSNSPGIRKWKKKRQKRWPPLQIPNGLSANICKLAKFLGNSHHSKAHTHTHFHQIEINV